MTYVTLFTDYIDINIHLRKVIASIMIRTIEDRDRVINALYNKCKEGEISVNQREALIQRARTEYMLESSKVEETVEEVPTEEVVEEAGKEKKKMSPKTKFNKLKKEIYQRCKDGEITEDQREELIEKARDLCFFSDDAKAEAAEEEKVKAEKEAAKAEANKESCKKESAEEVTEGETVEEAVNLQKNPQGSKENKAANKEGLIKCVKNQIDYYKAQLSKYNDNLDPDHSIRDSLSDMLKMLESKLSGMTGKPVMESTEEVVDDAEAEVVEEAVSGNPPVNGQAKAAVIALLRAAIVDIKKPEYAKRIEFLGRIDKLAADMKNAVSTAPAPAVKQASEVEAK